MKNDQAASTLKLSDRAVELMSQQVWCWGQDILRSQGNWLIEIGFERTKPPARRKSSSSIYTLNLAPGVCVVLRGFGTFYGQANVGGVFLPRFEFKPLFSVQCTPEKPFWENSDLENLYPPTLSQRDDCMGLTLKLLHWIEAYEENVLRTLGVEYRRKTLVPWFDGSPGPISAENMSSAWHDLAGQVAAGQLDLFGKDQA